MFIEALHVCVHVHAFNDLLVSMQIPTALSHHDLCNISPMGLSVKIYERVL